jgi:ceramide glucosyltransferase
MSVILGFLAFLSLALLLWQWGAALRFPLHHRVDDTSFAPTVSLLKPLKGADASTEKCLRSWFAQDYAGQIQILFGVASADDPACEVARKLMAEYPDRDAQLIVCGTPLGPNAKASKVAELETLAKHEILVISDADVLVPSDFLINIVAMLEPGRETEKAAVTPSLSRPAGEGGRKPGEGVDTPSQPRIGLVSCFYRLANPGTLAMRWEAIAVNADFWSQVLQSRSLKPLDFALGAVMAIRRKPLDEIGGFKSLVDCLADDYQLGNRVARRGHRIALCPVVVECWDSPMSWRAVWKHQLRWARTIRICQPLPYFFSILSNPTLWPLVWLLAKPGRFSAVFFGVACLVRILAAAHLQTRLTQSREHGPFFWLAPVKDLLQGVIWAGAFAGNRIEWRGRQFALWRDGTLKPIL